MPITLEVLHLVFSAFGMVHKIATFEKQAGLQALVQFDDTPAAELVSLQKSVGYCDYLMSNRGKRRIRARINSQNNLILIDKRRYLESFAEKYRVAYLSVLMLSEAC